MHIAFRFSSLGEKKGANFHCGSMCFVGMYSEKCIFFLVIMLNSYISLSGGNPLNGSGFKF